MKLYILLILISLTLISSCDNFKNSSNNKENFSNLYKWEFSDGVRWKTFGVVEEQVQYEGETKNGLPHGLGYTYDFEKVDVIYYGEWVNGKKHGEGTYLSQKGEWKDGERIK